MHTPCIHHAGGRTSRHARAPSSSTAQVPSCGSNPNPNPNLNPTPTPNPNPNPNQVDGPRHFLGRVPTGRTLLKRRQLRAADWRLVAVPYWDWNRTQEQPQLRREYMAGRLEEELQGAITAREIIDGVHATGVSEHQ